MNDEILFDSKNGWGVITLNAPQRMNALSREMCRAMAETLARWRTDEAIHAVMIRSASERAFCTGGDIRALYTARKAGDIEGPVCFFADEYLNNWRVARFPKPFVALIDGPVMGGGVGVSMHGDYRVCGDKAMFAMPECGIGLYPDVGATHLLPKLASESGTWLGLTGTRIGVGDMLGLGLATHAVPSDRMPRVESALHGIDWRDGAREAIERILDDLHEVPSAETPAIEARHEIRSAFALDSVEGIIAELRAMESDWANAQLEAIARGAPLSLKVTLRALRKGASLDISEALAFEYGLTRRFVETGAFLEGIRAQIIDKDRDPRWPHASLADVSDAEVDAMFAPVSDTPAFGWEELA